MTRHYNKFFITLVLLNILDVLFTSHLIQLGGTTDVEANPWMRHLIESVGIIPGLLLGKVPPLVILFFLRKHVYTWLWGLVLFSYTSVVFWSIYLCINTLSGA